MSEDSLKTIKNICEPCDKFFYYFNVIIISLLILIALFFALVGSYIEAVVLVVISYFIFPVHNTYDVSLNEDNMILKRWFWQRPVYLSFSKTSLRLYFVNHKFPYLSKAILVNDGKSYEIANNKLCWHWCIKVLLKLFILKKGKVKLFFEGRKINFTNKELVQGEQKILERLLRL